MIKLSSKRKHSILLSSVLKILLFQITLHFIITEFLKPSFIFSLLFIFFSHPWTIQAFCNHLLFAVKICKLPTLQLSCLIVNYLYIQIKIVFFTIRFIFECVGHVNIVPESHVHLVLLAVFFFEELQEDGILHQLQLELVQFELLV